MEISNFNTFYNINNNSLTVGIKTIKFLNVLDKSITNFFLDKYVYVTPKLKGILSNTDNEHLFTADNFGTLKELVQFVLKNNVDYMQKKEVKMIAAIDLEDFDNLDDNFIIELLDILNFSHLKYPIRFFFYTDNLSLYKEKFWFETIMTCIDDYSISKLTDEDREFLLERNVLNKNKDNELHEKDDILIFKSRV